MTRQYSFTAKEMKAAIILVQACLHGMGGKRPSDLEHDEYTWVDGKDLMKAGYSQHEAAGLFSSLHEKGFIEGEYNRRQCDTAVSTSGWRYIDTVWDNREQFLKAV